jgi:acetyltransferase-like isoleucine patch superfamily enzyme
MARFSTYRALERFQVRLNTLWARLRYHAFLHLGPRSRILGRVMVKPFWALFDKTKALSIFLDGDNSIGHGTVFQGSGTMRFGLRSFCGEYCVFGCNAAINIGNDVMIAQAVTIRDTDHRIADASIPMIQQGIVATPVNIEDNVWLGHGAIILKGVRIGTGAVVAAGSIVTKDVEPYMIVAGSPARPLKSRIRNQLKAKEI